ncbi:MAG: hypothetical protein C0596_05955 [Marinilabiliales bacterium]|nr:MAG: hypothetical protein C0596_05955 [Marinilabiliales bacterium]
MISDNTKNNWYALRTIPHKERHVCTELNSRDYEYYLPLYKIYYDKNKYKEKILISYYVFVYLSEKDFEKIRFIPGSRGLLLYDFVPAIVKREEIEVLRLICGELDLEPEVNTLVPGEKVKILNGVLKGYTARVCECKSNKLGIEILENGFTIWINGKDLLYESVK